MQDNIKKKVTEIITNLRHCLNATSYNGTMNKQCVFCDVLLTVHLSIILVINQLNAQILVL